MDGYYSTPVGPFATSIGAAFNTFTTRQFIDPLPVPVIPAYVLRPGTRLKIEAEGEYSTTGTPTLSIGCAFGVLGATGSLGTAVVLAEYTPLAVPVTTAVAWPWRLEYRALVTGVGTAGSLTGVGNVDISNSLTAFTQNNPIPSTLALRTVAVDTTIPRGVGIVATWGTSSVSNSIKVYNVTVLLQN